MLEHLLTKRLFHFTLVYPLMYSPTRHLHVNGCVAQANHNTDDISTITAKERLGENDILVTKGRRVVYHWEILKTIYERGHVGSQI